MGTKFSSGRTRQVYEFMRLHRHQYDVRLMCRVLEVAPSGYYAWLKQPQSHRAAENARLLKLIRASFNASNGIYGSPRVFLDLREVGETCSKHRVARLMREKKIRPARGYGRKPKSGAKPSALAPNILQRQFDVGKPNKAWVTDITYIRTGEGWLYPSWICSQGRSSAGLFPPTIGSGLVLDAVLMAVRRRRPKKTIIHSDQGSQYGSDDWRRFCKTNGLVPSMSRRGNCCLRTSPFSTPIGCSRYHDLGVSIYCILSAPFCPSLRMETGMRILSTLALAALVSTSAAASDETDVMSVVRQWIDALDKGDMKSFVSLCTEDTFILDDIPPYRWKGPRACSKWWSDNEAFGKSNDISDVFVSLGKPLQLYVTGDNAYIVTRDNFTYKMKGKPMKQTGSIHTFVLRKSDSSWRIFGEAWADTTSATPVTTLTQPKPSSAVR